LLQSLGCHVIESAIHHEPGVHEDLHQRICGANMRRLKPFVRFYFSNSFVCSTVTNDVRRHVQFTLENLCGSAPCGRHKWRQSVSSLPLNAAIRLGRATGVVEQCMPCYWDLCFRTYQKLL